MTEIILTSILLKLALAGVAVLAVVAILRWLDARAGFSFGKWVSRGDDISGNPVVDACRHAGMAVYLGARILAVCILLASILGCGTASAAIPDRYDREIRDAADLYLPAVDWRWWKAQLYQESRMRPGAVSPVGARGVAQFMPATWREVAAALGYGLEVSPHMVEPAILAGAYYMRQMRGNPMWRGEADPGRHRLACASYNAGAGNIRRAVRRAGSRDWSAVAAALPSVTGRHATETVTYVDRIWRWYAVLLVA